MILENENGYPKNSNFEFKWPATNTSRAASISSHKQNWHGSHCENSLHSKKLDQNSTF